MKTMRKKIISCLLALAMVFSVIKGTGVPVKADPGTESNTVKVNASYSGMKITDTEVSQRIVNTLDAMIKAESFKIVRLVGEESFTYYICIAEALVDMQYDFRLEYDTESKICTVYCNLESEPDAFETTLYSNVEGENIYSAITFCTYVELVFARDIDKINEELDEGAEKAYFSKGIDGTTYTLEDKFCPTENGENPYRIPYGGTFASIDDPKFVCFPEITYNGKRYYSWYLDEVNYAPVDPVKVDDSTTFTDLYNVFSVSFDEYAHNYPANTDTENVKWSWGTAENEYKDTSVKITCTDEECTESIFIENSEDFPNSISIDRTDIATTCTTDGKTIYTATAKYIENGTTYTYTSTKTVDGDKATGHQWEFDTADANAVWNEDNTTVTIKKSCTDTNHDTTKDGKVEVTVSSSDISNEVISATKCGEVSKTIYTATFDSSVDSTIVDPFTITKTVEGDFLQHDWVFDTDNVIWEGNDSDGYTKASITKTCKNTVHDGENNITVSSANIEKNIEPATEEDNTERTYYTAIFNSENDEDITNEFTVKKVVTKLIMPGCEFNVTSDVVWEKDEQGGYKSVTISKNYINSVTSSIEKTERVKSTKIESSVKAATECEQPAITTYTATFDSTVDPDIETAFTVSFDVKGEILKHDWEYDTENAVLSQEGRERYLITITKTCNNEEHTGENSVPVTSDKVTISTGAAITCGEHTTITYTATFDETVDPDITEAFDVEIEAEGPILQHNWEYVIDSQKAYWVGSESDGYTAVSIEKICTNPEHSKDTIVLCTSKKIVKTTEQAVKCGDASKTIYTATFDKDADSSITEPFTIQRILYGNVIQHNWKYDTENVTWDVGNAKATITKTCNNKEHGDQGNGLSISSSKITTSPVSVTKCGEVGTIRYTATFDNTIDPDITNSFYVYKDVAGAELKHNWKIDSITSNATYLNQPSEVTINLVCIRDSSHTETVVTKDIKVVPDTDGVSKKYIYTGTTLDGQTITTEETVYSHIEHKWDVIFNWVNVSTNKADTAATAEATCNVGNEKIALDVNITDKDIYNKIEYTATATDPNGKVWRDFRNIDKTNNEVKKGKAGPSIYDGGFTLTGLEEEYPYTGAAIKPAFEVVDNATGTTLANGVDYSVSYKDNKKIGTATIKIKGKGNYSGTNAEATFKIVNPKIGVNEEDLADLKGAKITAVSPKAFDYNGEAQYPETITLKLKGGSEVTYTGTNGENYVDADGNAIPAVVTFSGNVNKGTATVLLSGKQDAKKATKTTTVKKTFKINAVDLSKVNADDLIVTVDEKVEWAVKGAQPEVKVEYKGKELLAGQDYKVSYKNNKKIAEAQVDLSGKGNYAKTRKTAAKFTIEAFDLSQAEIIATTAADGVKGSKVKVTILDKAGNPIPASKLTVTVKKDGGAVTDKLKAGDEVTVEAAAKGQELMGSCSKDVTLAADLGKAKIKVNGLTKEYIGEEIKLDAEDMKKVAVSLKISGAMTELKCDEDFEIAGYSNNVKKGTMTVTIVGKGEKVSGSKTFKVKITAKPLASSK